MHAERPIARLTFLSQSRPAPRASKRGAFEPRQTLPKRRWGSLIRRRAFCYRPVMPLIHNDPEHWRKRAEEARKLANEMTDPVGKKAMLEIAEKYDRIVEQALERLRGVKR